MAGRTFALRFFRMAYWLLVPLAFCSSFFIYLPGPTLPLASLHPPVAAPASSSAELEQAPQADETWHYGENRKELVMMPQRPYKVPEWPYTVGSWGWLLGALLTPVVPIVGAGLLGSCLLVALRRQPLPRALAGRVLRWGSLPLALVLGLWVGIEVVVPLSYRYSARRAQPLIAALRQYQRDHPADSSAAPPLVPRYLAALPTPGTLGSGYFAYEWHPKPAFNYPNLPRSFPSDWSLNSAFNYPHAPAVFPAYRVEYVPEPFYYTNETQSAGFPDWQLRVVR